MQKEFTANRLSEFLFIVFRYEVIICLREIMIFLATQEMGCSAALLLNSYIIRINEFYIYISKT